MSRQQHQGFNLANFRSELPPKNRIARALWNSVWCTLFRPSFRPCHFWRRFLLRCFGAKIGKGVRVYSSSRIFAPWNLRMDDYSVLGDFVDCYCVARIEVGPHSVISQYSFLCTATHDYERSGFPLVAEPITIGRGVWVAADAFVAPGVVIGDGAVVGARASVFNDVKPWTVVVGNPAKVVKNRPVCGQGE